MHLCTSLAVPLLGILCASALSESPHVSVQAGKGGGTPGSALAESYQLGRGLVPSERAILLNYLTRTAAEHHLACTASWAEENLRLARQLPMDWNRLAIEKNAVVALSYAKPDRAMTLLRSMDLPVSDGFGFPEDVRSDGATIIFQNYWSAHRPKGLPELRAEAVYLGQTGQYPYRGIRSIVVDLAAVLPKEPGQLPAVARSLVLEAYSFYEHGSKFQIEDDDFVEFLQALHTVLPMPLLKQGLDLAVERLLDTDRPLDKQNYVAHVQTDKGTATFHRRQEKLLFDLLPLVRAVDPDWAAQIVRRNPTLGQADGYSGKELAVEGIIQPGETASSEQQSYGLQQSRAKEAGQLAATDPEAAMRMAQTIADPSLRTVALANIASAVGSSAPSQAGEIEKAIANTLPAIKDSQDRLLALSAQAKAAAAAGDMAGFRDALNRCFTLGEELFEEELDAHPGRPTYTSPSYNALDGLVTSGASFDPTTTASKVDQVGDIALKAYLLQSLARALYAVQKPQIAPGIPPKKPIRPKRGIDQPARTAKTP